MKRRATHAGSWYSADPQVLGKQLDRWLDAAPLIPSVKTRGIIGPHAGYPYSGATAAFAYKNLQLEEVERIFILGPSHHFYVRGCCLTKCRAFETPLGDLKVDLETVAELHETGLFEDLSLENDEAEHSIEMHLPYVRHVIGSRPIPIVPILVGSLTAEKERTYGELLSKYAQSPTNLFIASSDFCHWGRRFSYSRLPADAGNKRICDCIQDLDEQAMSIISRVDPDGFASYLRETGNTICGRHPIAVVLRALEHLRLTQSCKVGVKFVHYAQSSAATSKQDSSVSYAAALISID